jgi:hypothetical protein
MIHLAVSGWRLWRKPDVITWHLDSAMERAGGPEHLTVYHGDCQSGADLTAELWTVENHVAVVRFRADWYGPCRPECRHAPRKPGEKCRAAGPYRNKDMIQRVRSVAQGKGELLAFPETMLQPGHDPVGGTQGAMCLALEAGLDVDQVDYETGKAWGFF